jgi:hypothetical protein
MGFRTIDLDTKEGMEKYKKLKETKSVQETFGDKGIEKFAPRPEEPKKSGELPPKVEPKKDTTQDNIVRTGVVKGVSQLRVRIKPEGDILFLISEKSIVKILEDQDGWYKVETAPGRVGFVMKQFIEVRTEGG